MVSVTLISPLWEGFGGTFTRHDPVAVFCGVSAIRFPRPKVPSLPSNINKMTANNKMLSNGY